MVFVLCRVVGSQLAPQIADLAPSSDHEACRNLVCTASKALGVTCTDPTKANIFMENGEPAVLGSVVQGTMLYFGFNGEPWVQPDAPPSAIHSSPPRPPTTTPPNPPDTVAKGSTPVPACG